MNNYFYSFIMALLLCSCDVVAPTSPASSASSAAQFLAKEAEPEATNPENPYDYAGGLYNELLDSYVAENKAQTSLDSIVTRVTLLSARTNNYQMYFNAQPTVISSATSQHIISNAQTALTDYLAVSILSTDAQLSLQDFSSEVHSLVTSAADYAQIYTYIVGYESLILSHSSYSPDEQALVLHLSSIVRHAVYAKKKRPKPNRDPDWDWMLTCIVATSVESNGDAARGLLNAVVLAIADLDLPR